MKDDILKLYNELTDMIYDNYNQIKIVDNYDWNEESPYTIIYLHKDESFEKFEEAWETNKIECEEEDYDYGDILSEFDIKNEKKFDYINLGSLNTYTSKEYELDI